MTLTAPQNLQLLLLLGTLALSTGPLVIGLAVIHMWRSAPTDSQPISTQMTEATIQGLLRAAFQGGARAHRHEQEMIGGMRQREHAIRELSAAGIFAGEIARLLHASITDIDSLLEPDPSPPARQAPGASHMSLPLAPPLSGLNSTAAVGQPNDLPAPTVLSSGALAGFIAHIVDDTPSHSAGPRTAQP